MNLVENCEAIWPCGWKRTYYPTIVAAAVNGILIEARSDDEGVYAATAFGNSLQSAKFKNKSLNAVLKAAHEYIKDLPPIPDIVELTVQQRAGRILLEQGWEAVEGNRYQQGPFEVFVKADHCALWTKFTNSQKPIRTVDIGTAVDIRPLMRFLLTFPQWKE
jgi:hypothetical protein